jgi:hypothetical protein
LITQINQIKVVHEELPDLNKSSKSSLQVLLTIKLKKKKKTTRELIVEGTSPPIMMLNGKTIRTLHSFQR